MPDSPNYIARIAAEGEDFNYKVKIVDGQLVAVTPDGEALVTAADFAAMRALMGVGVSYRAADISAREIICNGSTTEVAGQSYHSILDALVYIATQGPECANQFVLRIQGLHTLTSATGPITLQSWVHMIGDPGSEIYCNDSAVLTFYSNPMIVLAANCWLKDVYGHAGPVPENSVVFGSVLNVTNVGMDGCAGIVDAATTPANEGDQAGMSVRGDYGQISGTIKNCIFTSANSGLRVQTDGLLRIANITATCLRQQKDEGASAMTVSNGQKGGLVVIRDSVLASYCDDGHGYGGGDQAPCYGLVGVNGKGGGSSTVKVFDCQISALHNDAGPARAIGVFGSYSATAYLNKAIAIETYNCTIEAESQAGECDGVYVTNAASKLLVDGGSIVANGDGTVYDATRVTSGSLTLAGVTSEGRFSGTMTHLTASQATEDSAALSQQATLNYTLTSPDSVFATFDASGTESDASRVVTIQFQDPEGGIVHQNVAFHVWEATGRMGITSNSLGTLAPVTGHGKTIASYSANHSLLVLSDAEGNAQITVAKAATALSAWIHVAIPATGRVACYEVKLGAE